MRMKRFLASLLALLMLFSLMQVFALAEGEEDAGQISLVGEEETEPGDVPEPDAEIVPEADEPTADEDAPAGLWVGGVEVTEENASNILGDGKVSFDSETNTLTFAAKASKLSGVYSDSVIYANIGDLTIQAPNGLSFSSTTAKYGVKVVGGALTVNGNLNLTLGSSDSEACIWVQNGLTANGYVTLDSYSGEDSYGVFSSGGPVAINGAVDFMCGHTGIYCGSGDISVSGAIVSISVDSSATLGFSPSACYYAANGGVTIDANLDFSFGKTPYVVYANGPVTVTGSVNIENNSAGGNGIVSKAGGIVCGSNVVIEVSRIGLSSSGEDAGISIDGNATLANQSNEMASGLIEAPDGPISVTGNLKVNGWSACLVSAGDDITVGGYADISVNTFDVNSQTNKAVRSENGSIRVTGYLKASTFSNSGVYAYKDISVGGNVTLSGSIQTIRDYGIMAETGALTVGGSLTATGVLKNVVYGLTGITVDGNVAITDTFTDNLDPTGCFAMNAPEGSVTVGGTLTIAPKAQYGYSGGISGPEFGVYAGDEISISKDWDVTADSAALRAVNGITMPDDYGVTLPRSGLVTLLDDCYTVTKYDGATEAAHAIISVAAAEEPVIVVGKSLSLEGKIALNFYLDLPEYVLTDPDAYVEIGGEKLPISEAEYLPVRGESGYRFTVKVKFAQLTEARTLRVFDGNGDPFKLVDLENNDLTKTGLVYRAQDYIEYIRENTEDKGLLKVVDTLSDVGSLAQAQFKYNEDLRVPVVGDLAAVTAADVEGFKPTLKTAEDSQVKYYGSSLLLQDVTTLRHYFKADAATIENCVFTVDGNEVTPEQKGGYYYIDIHGIVAKDLDKSFHVEVACDGTTLIELDYSALSYSYGQINTGKTTVLTDLAKAVYLYGTAADEYFTD